MQPTNFMYVSTWQLAKQLASLQLHYEPKDLMRLLKAGGFDAASLIACGFDVHHI